MKSVIFAIDIETSGPHLFNNAIISIGYCVGDLDGNILRKHRISLVPENRTFDETCYSEFWVKHLDVLTVLNNEAVPIKVGLTQFLGELDYYDNLYNIILLSDFPVFDIGFINTYIGFYLGRLPLYYKLGNPEEYRPIFDSDNFSRGLLRMTYEDMWVSDTHVREKLNFSNTITRDHYPENDAEYIYTQHLVTIKNM